MTKITYENLLNLSPEKRKEVFDLQRVIIQKENDLLKHMNKDNEKAVEIYKELKDLQEKRSALITQ